MNKQKGFSLLEILVAFSILAISLGILLKIFSSGLNTAVIAEKYTIAMQIAESLMAKTGIETPLIESEVSGIEDETYYWLVKVTPVSEPMLEDELMLNLVAIQVSVEWGDNELTRRSIELNTVRIKPVNDAL